MIFFFIVIMILIIGGYIFAYRAYYKSTNYRDGRVMLVSIPYEHKDDEGIKLITEKSKKVIKIIGIFHNLLMLMYFYGLYFSDFNKYLFNEYFAFTLILILMLPLVVLQVYLNKNHKQIKKIKSDNNWALVTEYEIEVDTRILADNLKGKYNKLLHLSLILTIIIGILSFLLKSKVELFEILVLLLNVNSLNLVMILILKLDNYIKISDDYKENYKANKEKIEYNYNLIYKLILIDFILIFAYIILTYSLGYMNYVFIFLNIFLIILWILFIIVFYKVNKKYEISNNNISKAGDFYDYYGYNNPYDNRAMVNSLVSSAGTEVNRGNIKGKMINLLSSLFLIVILVGSVIFLHDTIYASIDYTIEDNKLEIEVSTFNSTINLKEIDSLEFKEEIDFENAYRIIGNAMENYSAGSYNLKNYGNVTLYSYNYVDSHIVIKAKGKTYIFNEDTNNKTEKLFNKITKYIDK
ncbi:PH domain-containing protein [Miniphocaeibacter halophilus]|uniref:Uncharacterized protein n=1 Tax=Miniphocaeibacter halophilus TaxID=2931922 RepID=A0AC61MTA3_9FIRM|nr:PH domain-containing protein [Miniphocaeibacter halophilus]QQK07830.1 hypothetical protein JFY71_11220 [Miniphocaeibacter halophilus]